MSWTKRQLIEQAYEDIGYAGYTYDLDPERIESALRQLDAMISQWGGRGVRIGYPLPTNPDDSDLDTDSGIPDYAVEAVYTNLGIRLAKTVGKTLPVEAIKVAREAYDTLMQRTAYPPERQYPSTMPRGAGYKSWDWTFYGEPEDPVLAGRDGDLDF